MIKNISAFRTAAVAIALRKYGKIQYARFASAKLSYGQGGELLFNLRKRHYKIQFETVWEDHCLVDIEGLTGQNSIEIKQSLEDGKGEINDEVLEGNLEECVKISIKIPEDFTFKGVVNGSIQQIKSNVSNKLRCNTTTLNLIGSKRIFHWQKFQCPDLTINNKEGAIYIKSTTFQSAKFIANSFSSEKILLSEKVEVQTDYSINIRSIVSYGSAVALLKTRFLDLQSISGKSQIVAQKVKIDRMWASPNGINLKAQQIEKIGIQTGSGYIHSSEDIDLQKISLGRLHKGKIIPIDSKTVKII